MAQPQLLYLLSVMDEEDPIVTTLPIHYSDTLAPNVHIHQYPLLTRPLHVPPSAAASGKRIRARIKPTVKRLEVHLPLDTRQEVWNSERGKLLGQARVDDDREKNQDMQSGAKNTTREVIEPRLSEVRMQSEQIGQRGIYMLGIVRDGVHIFFHLCGSCQRAKLGKLHLHPISETHQLRPTLTYLDVIHRKSRRRGAESDDESDDGPPPDPDEPPPAPVEKKERKPATDAKDIQVSARKSADDKNASNSLQGGLSAGRREMLIALRAEEDEPWEELEFFSGEVSS
jgi:DNA-directed RNA polymerase III subunit RPC5